jgi:hypothetical protein
VRAGAAAGAAATGWGAGAGAAAGTGTGCGAGIGVGDDDAAGRASAVGVVAGRTSVATGGVAADAVPSAEGAGTSNTERQIEQRARTPPAGTLRGSTRKTVLQLVH